MLKKSIIVYSTDGCHLCELAIEVIKQSSFNGIVEIKDIMDKQHWLEAYQLRIPVIQNQNQQELDWPFNLLQFEQFILDA